MFSGYKKHNHQHWTDQWRRSTACHRLASCSLQHARFSPSFLRRSPLRCLFLCGEGHSSRETTTFLLAFPMSSPHQGQMRYVKTRISDTRFGPHKLLLRRQVADAIRARRENGTLLDLDGAL